MSKKSTIVNRILSKSQQLWIEFCQKVKNSEKSKKSYKIQNCEKVENWEKSQELWKKK